MTSIREEALPSGAYMPFLSDINPDQDKLFDRKAVELEENGKVYSKNLVETYLIQQGKFKGRMYHLFTYIDGKDVINYSPHDYYNLSEFIDISFAFSIFDKDDKGILPVPISPDYRLLTK